MVFNMRWEFEKNQDIIMERQWNQGCAQKRIQKMVNGR